MMMPIHANISNEEVLDLIQVAVLALDCAASKEPVWEHGPTWTFWYAYKIGISTEGLEKLHEKAATLIALSQESIHADSTTSETDTR